MRSQLIDQQNGRRTFALIFQTDDDPIVSLRDFARNNALDASHFTGIGGFREVTLAYFDWQRKDYLDIPLHEQVEVLMLAGDIVLNNGLPMVHAHVVVGKRDGSAHGGHLRAARVRPTLELVLTESPAHLHRRLDPQSGLPLIDLPTPG